jgi:hypothetical protein
VCTLYRPRFRAVNIFGLAVVLRDVFIHRDITKIGRDWSFRTGVSILKASEKELARNEQHLAKENFNRKEATHNGECPYPQNGPSPAGCAPVRTTFERLPTVNLQTSKVALTDYSNHPSSDPTTQAHRQSLHCPKAQPSMQSQVDVDLIHSGCKCRPWAAGSCCENGAAHDLPHCQVVARTMADCPSVVHMA